jgi:hypothetical protein
MLMPVILSQASLEEGATTIPQGSRFKRTEAQDTFIELKCVIIDDSTKIPDVYTLALKGDEIVSSAWKHAAVQKNGLERSDSE